MTVTELAKLVREMRQAQARFFRERNNTNLEASKALERQLDHAVADVLDPPTLFGREATP